MENTNEMKIIFDSRPENEGLARVAAAAFCTQLNPTLEEVADLKTAVSETLQKLWSLFLQQSRRRIVPGWDLHLWKRLWMR